MKALPKTHSAMKLAEALRCAGLTEMADRAATGHYHDYLSPLPLPDLTLLADLDAAISSGNTEAEGIRDRHFKGEFDATLAEGDEWEASDEGRAALAEMFAGRP